MLAATTMLVLWLVPLVAMILLALLIGWLELDHWHQVCFGCGHNRAKCECILFTPEEDQDPEPPSRWDG